MARTATARSPTRATVAYHEAGHVVLGVSVGVDVVGVTMRRTSTQHAMTHTRDAVGGRILAGVFPINPLVEALALGRVRYSLAGFAAERIFTGARGMPDDGAHGDLGFARQYVRAIAPGADDDFCTMMCLVQWPKTRAFVRRHWKHVQVVARALVASQGLTERSLAALLRKLPPIAPLQLPAGQK